MRIKKFVNFLKSNLIIITLFVLALFYRWYGVSNSYSFWVDEASTARFGKGVFETGFPKVTTGYSENAYYVTHYLTGLSFSLFGVSEKSARLPEIAFGSLVVLAVYLFSKEVFNRNVGLAAATLTTFSYMQIAWSRQARGYVILEFFILMTLLYLYRFVSTAKIKDFIWCILFALLAFFTHPLGLTLIPVIFLYLLMSLKGRLIALKKGNFLIATLLIIVSLLALYTIRSSILMVVKNVFSNLSPKGLVLYYHSLYWRQYMTFSLLTILSFIVLFYQKQYPRIKLLFLFLGVYLFTICYILHVPFEKYGLVILLFIFIASSHAINVICQAIFAKKGTLVSALLILFIIINGNKFVTKPKSFYTLNFDMKEIPELDYKKHYNFAMQKVADHYTDVKEVAFIDIDTDAIAWYVGEGANGYVPRGDVNNDYDINHGYRYLNSLDKLISVANTNKYGFVMLIEHNYRFYPEGMVDWVRNNLTLEIKEDHASFAPDWISWPIEFYSWGFTK